MNDRTGAEETPDEEHIGIGVVGRPSGLQGACHTTAFGRTLGALKTPVTVLIGDSPQRAEPIVLAKVDKRGKSYICQFNDIFTREQAQRLKNKLLFIPREKLPRLPGNEYFHFELNGMEAIGSRSGEKIGTVKDVHNYPSVDALEIVLENGTEIMVPLHKKAVVKVDKEAGRITIDSRVIEDLIG